VTLSGSHNKNKLVSLGKDDAGKPLPRLGTTTRQQEGYPLNAYFVVPYVWNDANHDGLIGTDEVTVSSTDTLYKGPATSTDQFTVATGFDLLKRKLRLNILADNKGGGIIFNQFNFLCTQTSTCQAKSDPNAPRTTARR
jgi:hypothetical protein